MGPNDGPSREIPIPPTEPEVVPEGPPAPSEGSPLKDYLLELEQEFQDQEDEGKV